jgi:hypothetical protein
MMIEAAQQTTTRLNTMTVGDLRAAGLTPRQIHRLQMLRDCLRYYPHIEYFSNDQWRRLLFLQWRYEHGEYADDMPPPAPTVMDVTIEQVLIDVLETGEAR